MPITPDGCIFCGGPRNSHEDIWAKWLKPYLPRRMKTHTLYTAVIHEPGREEGTRQKRPGDPHSTRVQCVCERCNNGWMSGLQDAVKPIALPLLNGDRCKIDSTWQQPTLAGWIAMFVMVAEFINHEMSGIPQSDREHLRGHRRPPLQGWRLWIGNYTRGDWPGYWAHNVFSVTEEDVPEGTHGGPDTSNTQSTAYVVGQLFLYVLSSSIPQVATWRFNGRGNAILRRIWPPNDFDLEWPPDETMGDIDADTVATAFGRFFDSLSRTVSE